jgi:hypothetical protein
MLLNKRVRNVLNSSIFETFVVDFYSYDICVLPNSNLVSCNFNSVEIFNENINQIKSHKLSLPTGVALISDTNELIISDHFKSCIYTMDFDLNIKKQFGSSGNEKNQLFNPCGVFIQDNLLYVSDSGNNRIQILSTDFDFIETIRLSYKPFTIKVSDTRIGISGSNGVYFYDKNTFMLKEQYLNIIGRLSYINSTNCFYVISYAPLKKGFNYYF